MKKYFFIIFSLILFLGISALAAPKNNAARFLYSVANCKQFTHEDNRKITVVMGWVNRKCYIKEITHYRTISCAIRYNELEHFSSELRKQFNFDEGLVSAVNIWPYLASRDFCEVKKRPTTPNDNNLGF